MVTEKQYECTKCGRRFVSKPPTACKACNDPYVRELPKVPKK